MSPYTDEYEAINNVPIVLAATACTSLELAETFIIIMYEGLWMNIAMDHTWGNPNQLRHLGFTVQDTHTVILHYILNLRIVFSCPH